jgi:tetratricopeptide (TPR) repeat protein
MTKESRHFGSLRLHLSLRFCIFSFFVLLFIPACSSNVFEGVSDDNADDAKLEEARMALDGAEYERAVKLLNDLLDGDPADSRSLAYLSQAHAGMAGLDTLDLLTIIDELDENGKSGSIDMVGLVLGDAEGDVTRTEVFDKLHNLNEAIDSLEQIEANGGSLSDDEVVQRSVLALARMAMVIADVVFADQDAGVGARIRLTESGLGALYSGDPDFDGDVDEEALRYLADDIERVQDAIAVLYDISSDNDLSEDFSEFEQDINPDGNTIISVEELEAYVGSLANN